MISGKTALFGCAAVLIALLCSACGGSGGRSNAVVGPAPNVASIVVNGGPQNNYANGLFVTVSVCAPNTSNCQTIPNVLVDTGSFGLRVLASALGTVGSSLPGQTDAAGNPVLECAQFVDSVVWGAVKTADVQIAGERAPSIPIEVIDSTVPVPAACKAIGPTEEDVASLGANGILGVGFFISDCGPACQAAGSSNPGFYYGCAGSSCSVIGEAGNLQVQNPVASFSKDNNGVVVQLPAETASAASLNGSLVFGIGTQSNNNGSAQVYVPDNFGNIVTTYKGQQYSSFLDTGSNAYFFLDSKVTGIPECSTVGKGFYCPSSPVNLSATNSSAQGGGGSSTVNFTIGDASQLFSTNADFVFPTLGGPNPGTFDWGLPFFFGRKVFVGLESSSTPLGAGPFWAY